jgi:hypothetical protein
MTLFGVSAVAFALIAAAAFAWWSREESLPQHSRTVKAWYTGDDGRTWFADLPNKVVPFDHQGKAAVRCYVWSCDGGKTKFVSHVERISAAARQRLTGQSQIDVLELLPGTREVKSPLTGDAGWTAAESPKAAEIQTPRCPGGKGGVPQIVLAE